MFFTWQYTRQFTAVFPTINQDLCFLPLERRTKWLVLKHRGWTQVGSTENTWSLHSDDTMSWRQAEVIRSCGPCWRHPAFTWSRVVYLETWLHSHGNRRSNNSNTEQNDKVSLIFQPRKAYMNAKRVLHSYLQLGLAACTVNTLMNHFLRPIYYLDLFGTFPENMNIFQKDAEHNWMPSTSTICPHRLYKGFWAFQPLALQHQAGWKDRLDMIRL